MPVISRCSKKIKNDFYKHCRENLLGPTEVLNHVIITRTEKDTPENYWEYFKKHRRKQVTPKNSNPEKAINISDKASKKANKFIKDHGIRKYQFIEECMLHVIDNYKLKNESKY